MILDYATISQIEHKKQTTKEKNWYFRLRQNLKPLGLPWWYSG